MQDGISNLIQGGEEMNKVFKPQISEIDNGIEGNNLCLTGGNTLPDPCVTGAAMPNTCFTGMGNGAPNMCMSGSSELID